MLMIWAGLGWASVWRRASTYAGTQHSTASICRMHTRVMVYDVTGFDGGFDSDGLL